jgi:glycosyltransferase 2 family protein
MLAGHPINDSSMAEPVPDPSTLRKGMNRETAAIPPVEIVAAFDFDGTLITGDTLLISHRLLKGRFAMAMGWLRLVPHLIAWKAGWQTTTAFKQQYLREIFNKTSAEQRRRLLQQRLPEILLQHLRPEAHSRLRWHQQQGHRILIVSASPRALLQPVAEHLGVDLIATETTDLLQHTAAHPLQLTSPNCKGPEKVRRLEAWLGFPPTNVPLHAYGDSSGDLDLLIASSTPHWRSFAERPVTYPTGGGGPSIPWSAVLGIGLLILAGLGLNRLSQEQRQALGSALRSLLHWLPALYGVLALSYGFRYWRWRVLLGSLSIGRWGAADLAAWFRGFALTATPGKLGELSRVHDLHRDLGYPRGPLVHVFFAERIADGLAVASLLLILAPAQLLSSAPARGWSTPLLTGLALLLVVILLFRKPMRNSWVRWRHHLPSGALSRAVLPAVAVSMMVWISEPLLLWILVHSLSSITISIPVAITIYLLSGTAGMASTLPGGIGVNEAATVLLLNQQGIPAAIGLPIAIVRRLITPWSVVALASLSGTRGARNGD